MVRKRDINVLGNPRAAVDFTLPIRAQQVSDPVAEEFSLNTTFVLLSKRELWLADSQMQVTETSDVAFPEGKSALFNLSGTVWTDEGGPRTTVQPVLKYKNIFRCSNLWTRPS